MSVFITKNVGKSYITYHSEMQRFMRWFGFNLIPSQEHWALRNTDLVIQPSDSVGVIGKNGAGKSTLLKLISGVLKPSEGEIHINGRISAILELGMGFNHELTGRQNAIHYSSLMGYSMNQIMETMPEIEEFCEIGKYFDEPMRKYSSGMWLRVAFSVATAYKPDLLVVDEALAVGDIYFQHKCFDRISKLRENGCSLLVVSHDKTTIQSLCDRVILLEDGKAIKEGNPDEVLDYYNASISGGEDIIIKNEELGDGRVKTSSGTEEAKVTDVKLFNSNNKETDLIDVGELIEIRVEVNVLKKIDSLVMGFSIKNRLGQVMFGTNTWYRDQVIREPKIGEKYQFIVSLLANLGEGSYSISVALHQHKDHLSVNYNWVDLCVMFNVINNNKVYFEGSNYLEQNIEIKVK